MHARPTSVALQRQRSVGRGAGVGARSWVSSPAATYTPKLSVTQMYCVQTTEPALGAEVSAPVRAGIQSRGRPALRALGELLIGVAERWSLGTCGRAVLGRRRLGNGGARLAGGTCRGGWNLVGSGHRSSPPTGFITVADGAPSAVRRLLSDLRRRTLPWDIRRDYRCPACLATGTAVTNVVRRHEADHCHGRPIHESMRASLAR